MKLKNCNLLNLRLNLQSMPKEMPKVYGKVNDVDRERLIQAWEFGEDYKLAARTLGIGQSNTWKIINSFIKTGKKVKTVKGGRKKVKIDDEMCTMLEQLLQENAQYTLMQLNAQLRTRLPDKPQVTEVAVAKRLQGMLYTVKITTLQPMKRNSPENIQKRHHYANWYLSEGISKHCIFIDETGYNLWTKRTYGRSKKGTVAVRQVSNQRGRHVTLCLALSPQIGIVHKEFSVSSFTGDNFNNFIGQLVINLHTLPSFDQTNYVLIFDNAPVHKNVPNLPQNVEVQWLAPYSPFLNPCEEAFSAWKANLKSQISNPVFTEIINNPLEALNANMNMEQWRCYQMTAVGEHCLKYITAAKSFMWFSHMQTFLLPCLNDEIL